MYGHTGKVLHVDLTNRTFEIEEPSETFYRTYGGGQGFVAYYLLHQIPAGADPLGPDNALVFATGPATAGAFSGSARHTVGAKSPLSGAFGTADSGGFWGHELKTSGWDAVIIKGKSATPVYLWLKDDVVEFRPADKLWGQPVFETEEEIRKELADKRVRVSAIGPAGEKLSRIACIMNDCRSAAGRTGLGAVMGSKGLKAIAVRGTGKANFADADKVREMGQWAAASPAVLAPWLLPLGTGQHLEAGAATGNLPVRNFVGGFFQDAPAISVERLQEHGWLQRMEGCYACAMRCKKTVEMHEPFEINPAYGGPEYETIGSFGSDCGINDLKVICMANQICNANGLDTISAGCTIAFAMECFENGILTTKDTGGIELRFGDTEGMLTLLDMMVQREGIGDWLADGTAEAARKIGRGSERYAIHVKGEELPMHEPRLKAALGLGYAVSPTGADHMHNVHDTGFAMEGPGLDSIKPFGILEPMPNRELGVAKVRLFVYVHLWRHLFNVLDLCAFVAWPSDMLVDLVRAATGWKTNVFELMKMAERCVNLARVFNMREGLTAADDRLPERMFDPHPDGALSDHGMDRQEVEAAIRSYYGMMGWDRASGVPTQDKLDELNIGWAGQHLPR